MRRLLETESSMAAAMARSIDQRRVVMRGCDLQGNARTGSLGGMRDRLIAELDTLTLSDDAALWAHHSLPQKNKLTAPDALQIEAAFEGRVASFTAAEVSSKSEALPAALPTGRSKGSRKRGRPDAIDKSVLTFAEPRRLRDREHVKFVATHPCLICGRRPSDAHHLRFAQSRALGRKVSDEFTVPLCRGHHREIHRCGDEAAWWKKVSVDPTVIARSLWLQTHPLPQQAIVEHPTTRHRQLKPELRNEANNPRSS